MPLQSPSGSAQHELVTTLLNATFTWHEPRAMFLRMNIPFTLIRINRTSHVVYNSVLLHAYFKMVKAHMIKHQAIQFGIAKFGGICNSWRHYGFMASAHSWSQNCPQLSHDWYMTKNKEPELGINQICCRKNTSQWYGVEQRKGVHEKKGWNYEIMSPE